MKGEWEGGVDVGEAPITRRGLCGLELRGEGVVSVGVRLGLGLGLGFGLGLVLERVGEWEVDLVKKAVI